MHGDFYRIAPFQNIVNFILVFNVPVFAPHFLHLLMKQHSRSPRKNLLFYRKRLPNLLAVEAIPFRMSTVFLAHRRAHRARFFQRRMPGDGPRAVYAARKDRSGQAAFFKACNPAFQPVHGALVDALRVLRSG